MNSYNRAIITFFVLFILTSLLFRFSYSENIVPSIPWLRNSFLLTINTIGWSGAACYAWIKGAYTEIAGAVIIYVILIAPFSLLSVGPTYDDFGNDASVGLYFILIGFLVLHGSGFYLLVKKQEKFIEKVKSKLD